LFSGLGCLPGYHHINVKPEITPVIHAPRKVPIALRDRVKAELQRMVDMDVIERQDEPTEWVSSMVVVVKPNKIRICIDQKDLNRAIKREHYPMQTVDDIVTRMPNAKIFSIIDACSEFWQIQLYDASSCLCTFNTPFGRYRLKRLPFGISSASEVFQKQMSQMFEDLDGVECVVDDILVWGNNEVEHNRRLKQVLEGANARGFRLNKSKCKFNMTELKYVGHVLSRDGLKPDPDKITAVRDMKAPHDKSSLRRFMGMVQYLGKFVNKLSDITASLRKLLEDKVQFVWNYEQQECFTQLKNVICDSPVLKYYDVAKPVTLSVDASSEGLAAVILQEQSPVAYASRALTKCQKMYAQIEKELLAIMFG
jgi:hypothetical protein